MFRYLLPLLHHPLYVILVYPVFPCYILPCVTLLHPVLFHYVLLRSVSLYMALLSPCFTLVCPFTPAITILCSMSPFISFLVHYYSIFHQSQLVTLCFNLICPTLWYPMPPYFAPVLLCYSLGHLAKSRTVTSCVTMVCSVSPNHAWARPKIVPNILDSHYLSSSLLPLLSTHHQQKNHIQ